MPGERSADFERALADPADPAIATAEIASELRRGAEYVRVTIALTVLSTDVAGALSIVWDAFRGAARDDLTSVGRCTMAYWIQIIGLRCLGGHLCNQVAEQIGGSASRVRRMLKDPGGLLLMAQMVEPRSSFCWRQPMVQAS